MQTKRKFTQTFINTAPLPEKRERTYTCAVTPGLTLRVLKTGQKTFYARLWNPRTKRISRVKLGDADVMSLAGARKAVQSLKQEAEERRHTAPVEIKDLAAVFAVFEQDMEARGVSTSYRKQIKYAWDAFPAGWKPKELDEITPAALSLFLRKLYADRPGTAYSCRRVLRGLWKLALTNRWCKHDSTIDLPKTTIAPRRDMLTEADLSCLLDTVRTDAAEHPERSACFLLLAATGQRTSEVRNLFWCDIAEDRITFSAAHRKQRNEHTVYRNDLADEALALLPRGIGKTRLFTKGGRGWMSSYAARLQQRTGIAFHMHQLRKALISRLLSQGIPVHVVAGISGHKDVATLMRW